jgi:hypothetical protein
MMIKVKKTARLAIVIVVAAAIWIAIDLSRPVSSNLREFDPEVVARLDTEMWRSYYDKERLKLFNQLASLLRQQYHMPTVRSYVVAFRAAKAAFVFKDGKKRADYERALPDLVTYYQAIREVSETPFDVNRAAALELEWWIVHRERHEHAEGDLDQALANLAAEVYRLPATEFAEHARYRAEAMAIRDTQAEKGPLSQADWDKINDLLRKSWFSLWHAVNEAE